MRNKRSELPNSKVGSLHPQESKLVSLLSHAKYGKRTMFNEHDLIALAAFLFIPVVVIPGPFCLIGLTILNDKSPAPPDFH